MATRYIIAIVAAVLLMANAAGTALAQTMRGRSPFSERWESAPVPPAASQKEPPKQSAPKPDATAKPAHNDTQTTLPVSVDQALYLIRSTLLTLNDANRSGNYSVLRDLAAPDFQARNSAADLALSFSDLRRRNFDLFAAAIAAPQLTAAPALDPKKMLRLTGLFPTRPLQINFDLLFQNVGGQWRLFGISVATPQAPPLSTNAPPASTTVPPTQQVRQQRQ
jgi:hypothetical protein